MDLCQQSNVYAFNTLSRFVKAFLPRSKCLLISWLQSPYAAILEPKKIKSVTVSIVSPSAAAAAAKSLQSCLTVCDPIEASPLGSPVPGILQARILEWVTISFSTAWKWKVKVKQLSHVWLFATLWNCSLPGCSIHGIFKARVVEWVAIALSEDCYMSCKICLFKIK